MDRRNLYIIHGMFLMNSFTEALREEEEDEEEKEAREPAGA